MKFRKKPVVIEAVQLTKNNIVEVAAWIADNGNNSLIISGDNIIIPTLEGDMKANSGDYIIKGVKGEFYPCRKDIFEETYETARE